jgi:hypothetical protein
VRRDGDAKHALSLDLVLDGDALQHHVRPVELRDVRAAAVEDRVA